MTDRSSPPPLDESRDGELRLPKPPGVLRQFWVRHPLIVDVVVMLLYAIPESIFWIAASYDFAPGLPLKVIGIAMALTCVIALVKRRSAPYILLGVSLLPSLVLSHEFTAAVIAQTIALYTIAVYRGVRQVWVSFGIASAAVILGSIVRRLFLGFEWVGDASPPIATLVIATLVGINIGNRKRYIGALVDRAAQLARERDQQAQLAAASERSRIAREMHDIVAHSLSVMVRLADGAEAMVLKDPEASVSAVRSIGDTGRTSLAEMRRLLGVLREEETLAEMAPQPGLDGLADLIESYRATGLPVRVRTTGDAPNGQGAQIAVYRAVQESLTNALRYADQPSEVLVELDYSDGVELTVTDDGRAAPSVPSLGGGGRGLIGMSERAALYGGSVESGRLERGGWRVHMTMPEARGDER